MCQVFFNCSPFQYPNFDFRLWLFSEGPPRDESGAALSRLRPSTVLLRLKGRSLDETFDSERNLVFIETPPISSLGTILPLPSYNDKSGFQLTDVANVNCIFTALENLSILILKSLWTYWSSVVPLDLFIFAFADEMMMFIKLYQPKLRTFSFLGHLMMNFHDPLINYTRTICDMAALPENTRLDFYEVVIYVTSLSFCKHLHYTYSRTDIFLGRIPNDNEFSRICIRLHYDFFKFLGIVKLCYTWIIKYL